MNDKDIMEGILLTAKGICGLYMHGAIESGTANVHQCFTGALNQALSMQEQVYKKMVEHGWYTAEQAQQQKLQQVKQKFACCG